MLVLAPFIIKKPTIGQRSTADCGSAKSKRLEYALYVTSETFLYVTKGQAASPMYLPVSWAAMALLIQATRG